MIPRTIHYCWFGRKPLPKSALSCIASWKKFLPDYEIKEWNEDNFDVYAIPYTKEAYEAKKYAFVSDYARFKILYEEGGLYFDTDVELIRPLDDIIARGPFMGCEQDGSDMSCANVNSGLGLGVNPGLGLYQEILSLYGTLHFLNPDGSFNQKTVVAYVTELLMRHGLHAVNDVQYCAGVYIYPCEYFCPISVVDGKMRLTNRTVSIHHYDQSWQSPVRKYGRKLALKVGGVHLKTYLKRLFHIE